MTALQVAALIAVAVGGTAVALTRDPRRQAVVGGVFGLALGVLFFVFQAPDVAISQLAVSAIGLPVMVLLALARLERDDR